ncbi:CPBP family intramembrane glutamic endopeptidase [Mollicutes bacterium LVI A0039]|nr:CPBP family intramembrane glutamic endopeptidase [Mollicutes bacterium LVI A0039]
MEKYKNQLSGIGIIIVFYLLQKFIVIVYQIYAKIVGLASMGLELSELNNIMMSVGAVIEMFFIASLIYFYRKPIRDTLSEVKSNLPKFFQQLLMYFVLYLFLMWLIPTIDMKLFSQYTGNLGSNEQAIQNIIRAKPNLLLFSSLALWGPIIEEYVFRYAIIGKLLSGINRYVAAIIATLIFCFIHIGFGQLLNVEISYTIHLFLMYMPISLTLNFIYAKEQNLLYPIIIHIINNTLSTILAIAILFMI